jgi:hypothetical protein
MTLRESLCLQPRQALNTMLKVDPYPLPLNRPASLKASAILLALVRKKKQNDKNIPSVQPSRAILP